MERFHSVKDSLLLVPTATMAEHLRNEMARAGVPVRPSRVQTLAKYLEEKVDERAASKAALHLAMEHALERVRPTGFEGVREFRGFRNALADLFEELPAPDHAELGPVFQAAKARLEELGLGTRKERLKAAAALEEPGAAHIVFDGFFSLTEEETALVESLGRRAEITLVLPEAPARLLKAGFVERPFREVWRRPRRESFQARTLEQEVEEIARRVAAHHARGVPFREMGVVLRSRAPHGPAVEGALLRFGIPVRSYFTDAVVAHPVAAFLAGAVRAELRGWNWTDLAVLLRMPVSGLGGTAAGDRFDYELRRRMPGAGLEIVGAPDLVARIAEWSAALPSKAEGDEWAKLLKGLPRVLPVMEFSDRTSREQIAAWASAAQALEQWGAALDEAAVACTGLGSIPLEKYWEKADTVLSISQMRPRDRRRDAVALMDVFEVRQWQLRVVFVPGMIERLFPHYHREDPILGDRERARLGLKTAQDRQREEKLLFDIAVSRATEEAVLSYARFNEKGDEVLPSFFWDQTPELLPQRRIQPRAERAAHLREWGDIEEITAKLAEKHKTLSPSGVEQFLQCPFLFFAGRTLKLAERPPKPRERLDVLAQGSILHDALRDWAEMPLLGAAALTGQFDAQMARRRVPEGYRTEAVRLELLRHFEAFLADDRVPLAARVTAEQPVEFTLAPGLAIKGRIDRIDFADERRALIIDYKYSAGDRIKEHVEKAQDGDRVQAGLYLRGAETALGLEPVGMLYCGLRKKVAWGGWHVGRKDLLARGVGEARTRDGLLELEETAKARTIEAQEAILRGSMTPAPSNRDLCNRCDYYDICRIESMPAVKEAGE